MMCSQSGRQIWLLAFLFAFTIGCGGTDGKKPQGDETPVPASPKAPQTADDLLKPGEPQLGTSETESFPRVEFQTTEGAFTVKLHRDRVPKTVENFLQYVDAKFYDGTIFHDVVAGYAVVGGNYTMTDGIMRLKEGGGNSIRNEAENGLPNNRGTIGMAREPEDADSARCQFYFNLADNSGLNYRPSNGTDKLWETAGYCVFGEVEGDGLQILEKIAKKEVAPRNDMAHFPIEPITIISVRRL